MTDEREAYLLFRDQVNLFDAQTKRKETRQFKILPKLLADLNTATLSYGMSGISRSLLIGMTASMQGILKSESTLGLFSDDFDRLAKAIANAVALLENFHNDEAKKRVFSWYIEFTIIAMIGLLHLATEIPQKDYEEEESKDVSNELFKKELIISLVFYSEYPKTAFRTMAESLGLKEKGVQFVANSLEVISLFAVLMAFKKENATVHNITNTLLPRLSSCLFAINSQLAEANLVEEDLPMGFFQSFLQQAMIAIEKQDIEPFIQTFTEGLESFGYANDTLQEDVHEIKHMFNNIKEAAQSTAHQQVSAVNIIG